MPRCYKSGKLTGGERRDASGRGGGNLVGSVTCGQSYSPQCDVMAGSGPSAGTPAGPGTQAGGQQAPPGNHQHQYRIGGRL